MAKKNKKKKKSFVSFSERLKPATTLQYDKEIVPCVIISSVAMNKMRIYVNESEDEIGWLGFVEKVDETTYNISDVMLFEQEVHSSTTEISPENLVTIGTELIKSGNDGVKKVNSLRLWGHSHVDMSVNPSGQDNDQMDIFKENNCDWFVRIIANKKSQLKVDVFNYKSGLDFINVPWFEDSNVSTEEIDNKITATKDYLESLNKERISIIDKSLNNVYDSTSKEINKNVSKKKTKNITTINQLGGISYDEYSGYDIVDWYDFTHIDVIYYWLDEDEIMNVGISENMKEALTYMDGLELQLLPGQLKTIYETCKKHVLGPYRK